MDSIMQIYNQTIKMLLYNYFKTDNPFIDAIVTTVILSIFGNILMHYENLKDIGINDVKKKMNHFFYKTNKVIVSGKNCTYPSSFGDFYVSSVYSDRFNAIIDYLVCNSNDTICEIKESFCTSSNNSYEKKENFIVCQKHEFSIDPDIYFFINTKMDEHESNDKISKIENITIEIYSYCKTIKELTSYVDNITTTHRKGIHDDRITKQFIYTAIKTDRKEDECKYSLWDEQIFTSNRKFENLFLENKKEIEEKIDFFLNNKEWYDDRGIPYNLGIGLHGSPGTGKTSFIKALANKTNRDIVVLPLKIIHTKRELNTLFYENTYNTYNVKNSKPFDKKIIVFEDIDCIGDIVKKRDTLREREIRKEVKNKESKENDLVNTINKALDNTVQTPMDPKMLYLDPLTLDDFLNLWDGIRETPGRIIVITSNHYDQLDPALIRPGRIDMTYEFKKVNHEILKEMHHCFYGKEIPKDALEKIEEYKYSPAEIVNYYMCNRNNENKYLSVLSNY